PTLAPHSTSPRERPSSANERGHRVFELSAVTARTRRRRTERGGQVIDMDKAALLVVDVQHGFVNEHSEHVVPVITDLEARWARAGRPTVFTRYWNYTDSPWERLIGWKALYGPPETDLVDELIQWADEPGAHTLDKTVYAALTPEGIDLLRTLDVTDLVICGIAADACVLKTTVDAFELGYTPW